MIRYVVLDRVTREWMMTIYADGSRKETPACVNYLVGDTVVAQVNPELVVVDSGGRTMESG
ncbi:MAG TPA: hypothetical protein VIO57_10125 [Chloroflexota bacterium]|jgi:serine protease inhibitor ecotin